MRLYKRGRRTIFRSRSPIITVFIFYIFLFLHEIKHHSFPWPFSFRFHHLPMKGVHFQFYTSIIQIYYWSRLMFEETKMTPQISLYFVWSNVGSIYLLNQHYFSLFYYKIINNDSLFLVLHLQHSYYSLLLIYHEWLKQEQYVLEKRFTHFHQHATLAKCSEKTLEGETLQ